MTSRIVTNAGELSDLVRLLQSRKLPFTVAIKQGKHRTNSQNALLHKWFNEIAAQLGDRHAHEVKAHCKLNHGVKMMVVEDEGFRAKWHSMILGRFNNEEKLSFMLEPWDFPVSRLMSSEQMTRYLDAIHAEFTSLGVQLTIPERG